MATVTLSRAVRMVNPQPMRWETIEALLGNISGRGKHVEVWHDMCTAALDLRNEDTAFEFAVTMAALTD